MIEVRKHSSYHIEVKSVFPLSDKKKVQSDMHYYIYSPAQLNMNKETVNKLNALNTISTYGRFGSPSHSFEQLMDLEDCDSPLYRLVENLKNQKENEKAIISELQLLSNAIRHQGKREIKRLEYYVKTKSHEDVRENIENFIKAVKLINNKIRDIMQNIEMKGIIESGFLWADEILSLTTERQALSMYSLLDQGDFQDIQDDLITLIKDESEHRVKKNYMSAMGSKSSESISYRASKLKKWSQSILYLQPTELKTPKRIGNILAGAAAGVAMTFAVIASIFAEKIFLKNSYQWALIVILVYIFKDRIKETLRLLFNALVPRLLADSVSTFSSPRTGIVLCKTKMKVEISKANNQEQVIKKAREVDDNPFRSMLPDNDVIHFSRFINIYKAKSKKHKFISKTFTLIDRIRVDDFAKEMDDTPVVKTRSQVDDSAQDRVYHLHFIARELNYAEDIDRIEHHLIVMSKEGIIRLEKLL